MSDKNSFWLREVLKLAEKAYEKGEVPIGAVIVKDNKIIAKGYNRKEKDKIATRHAEIIAIEKASKKLKDWRLTGATMYVSLKPCQMCLAAIEEARISKVVYIAEEKKACQRGVKLEKVSDSDIVNKSVEMLKNFFIEKR